MERFQVSEMNIRRDINYFGSEMLPDFFLCEVLIFPKF